MRSRREEGLYIIILLESHGTKVYAHKTDLQRGGGVHGHELGSLEGARHVIRGDHERLGVGTVFCPLVLIFVDQAHSNEVIAPPFDFFPQLPSFLWHRSQF